MPQPEVHFQAAPRAGVRTAQRHTDSRRPSQIFPFSRAGCGPEGAWLISAPEHWEWTDLPVILEAQLNLNPRAVPKDIHLVL